VPGLGPQVGYCPRRRLGRYEHVPVPRDSVPAADSPPHANEGLGCGRGRARLVAAGLCVGVGTYEPRHREANGRRRCARNHGAPCPPADGLRASEGRGDEEVGRYKEQNQTPQRRGLGSAQGGGQGLFHRGGHWLRDSPSDSNGHKRVSAPGDAEGLQAIVQNAAEALGKKGERYAQLLEEKDAAQEREDVVDSIRTVAGFILGKADLPAPEAVLQAVTGLATAD
jgi:hypothetical protein